MQVAKIGFSGQNSLYQIYLHEFQGMVGSIVSPPIRDRFTRTKPRLPNGNHTLRELLEFQINNAKETGGDSSFLRELEERLLEVIKGNK